MKKTTTDSAKQLLAIKQKVSTQWIRAHQHQYAEQYVALESDTLIAHGKTRRELVEVLKKKEKKAVLLLMFQILKKFIKEDCLTANF